MKINTSALFATIITASLICLHCEKKASREEETTIPKKNGTDRPTVWAAIKINTSLQNNFENASYFVFNGTPFAAYPEVIENGDGKATVKRFVDGAWNIVGKPNFTVGSALDISLFIYRGIPFIAYTDIISGMTVMKFDSTRWKVIGTIPSTSANCDKVSLFICNDTPFVAYRNSINPSRTTIAIGKFDGTSWRIIGEIVPTKRVSHLSLDVSSGVAYIAYSLRGGVLGDSGTAEIKKFDGKNWIPVGDTEIEIEDRYNIAISTLKGVPYLSVYASLRTHSLRGQEGEVRKFNGKSWEPIAIPDSIMGELVRVSVNDTLFPGGMKGPLGSTRVGFLCATEDCGKITPSAMQPSPVWKDWKTWRYLGDALFANPMAYRLCVSVDKGIPYIAFTDAESKKITVMNHGANGWENVGDLGMTGEFSSPLLRVFNSTPYIAFSDSGNDYKATVLKYDGSRWVPVGRPGFTAERVGTLSLFIDNAVPFLAFNEHSDSGRVSVMRYSGTDWIPIGKKGFGPVADDAISLFVYLDTPFVAIGNSENGGKATVMKFDGADWITVGNPAISVGKAKYPSLVVFEGTPYISYVDCGISCRVMVQKFAEGTWRVLGDGPVSANEVYLSTLCIENGTPYVSYTDVSADDSVCVKKFTGDAWETVGWNGIMRGTSALCNDRGILYVACAGDSGMTVMMYK